MASGLRCNCQELPGKGLFRQTGAHAVFEQTVLSENMVLTLEPSLSYGDGLMMVHEANIVVTPQGGRLLTTRAAPKLPVI